MNITDLYNDVCQALDKTVTFNEFKGCLNTVIRRLNSEAEKDIELIQLTGSETNDWEDLTTDNWESMTTNDWEDELRFISGVDWDSVNYAISLPVDYKRVLSLFYDDTKLHPTSYDVLKSEATTEYYTTIGNVIYFNTDLAATSAVIKARVKRDYPVYASGVEYTGLPEMAYTLLHNGVCYMLAARPKYMSELALALYKNMYEQSLDQYNKYVLAKDLKSNQSETQFYTW